MALNQIFILKIDVFGEMTMEFRVILAVLKSVHLSHKKHTVTPYIYTLKQSAKYYLELAACHFTDTWDNPNTLGLKNVSNSG